MKDIIYVTLFDMSGSVTGGVGGSGKDSRSDPVMSPPKLGVLAPHTLVDSQRSWVIDGYYL